MLLIGIARRVLANQSGFTLIELLAVAVILIILSLLAVMNIGNAADKTRMSASSGDLRTIETALERYKTEFGYYPDRLKVLADTGYLKSNVTFQSRWSNPNQHVVWLFYAVDHRKVGTAMAYALGDPGPECNDDHTIAWGEDVETTPLPCGHNPADVAFVWIGSIPTLDLLDKNGTPVIPTSLRGFRSDLRTES